MSALLTALVDDAVATATLPAAIDASLGGGGAPAGTGYVHVTGGAYDVPSATIPNADVAGLGSAALVATSAFDAAGDAAAAQAAAILASAQRASNLSDLASAGTARTNLGLGTAATHATTDYDASGAAAAAQAAAIAASDSAGAAAAAQAAAIAASAQRASNLSDLANAGTARTNLGLGGAAVLSVGVVAGTVAAGDDTRLTNARTPTAHAASHNAGGSDALAIDAVAATGSLRTLGTGAAQAAAGNDARLSDARTPSAHATSHNAGGSDALAIDAAAATGSLRTLGTAGTQAAAGDDSRLSDARTPSAHASTHRSGGTDPVGGLAVQDTTLTIAQVIGATQLAVLYGALLITTGTLTIAAGGQLFCLNLPYGT